MDELKTEEAKLWKAMDKLEASIQHNEAEIRTWLPLEYELNPVYGEKECGFNEYMKNLQEYTKQLSLDKIAKESKKDWKMQVIYNFDYVNIAKIL